jgi:hypothetical protein
MEKGDEYDGSARGGSEARVKVRPKRSTRMCGGAGRALLPLALLVAAACGDASSTGNPVTGETPLTCPQVVDTSRCDPQARFRIHVKFDFAVNPDGMVSVVTQSGPFEFPPSYLDGKSFVYLVTAKGEIFQGDLREALAVGGGTMHGTVGELTTDAVFPAGEVELLSFIDAVPGPPGFAGPDRGDLAAFDNSVCDPTGVSIRIPIDCKDADVTVRNQQFIIF